MNSGTEMQRIGFRQNSNDGTPPRNIGIFNLFDGELRVFENMSSSWHGAAKSEIKNPGGNIIFNNAEQENNFEGEKVGHKNL